MAPEPFLTIATSIAMASAIILIGFNKNTLSGNECKYCVRNDGIVCENYFQRESVSHLKSF
jgi:uncharacterized ferredoxin-like protein